MEEVKYKMLFSIFWKYLCLLFSVSMRPLLMLCLMSIFFVFFGLPAIQRFEEKKVMVITSQRKTGGIKVPAITIAARNPETEVGWRNGTFGNLYEIDTICNFTTSHDMEACIVGHTYDHKEI